MTGARKGFEEARKARGGEVVFRCRVVGLRDVKEKVVVGYLQNG